MAVTNGENGQAPDPSIREILGELRDMRAEMRDDRRQADAERRQAEADRRQAEAERREAEARTQQFMHGLTERYDATVRRSDERFAQAMREFREDSARHAAETQRMFKDIHGVGLSIVRTLNRHTRLLERIDRKLGTRGNGGFGRANGPGR